MAEFVFKNAKILVGGADLSGDMNEVTVTRSADILDKTVFGSSAKRRLAGLKDFQVAGGGFFEAATTQKIASHIPSKLGTGSTGTVVTVAQNSSLGSICYSGQNVISEYSPSGKIGEMMKFNFACYGDGIAVRGVVMQAGTGLSTGLSLTPRNLGFRAPTQRLYGIVQVRGVSSSGGTHVLRPRVQIASSSGFVAGLTTAINMSVINWNGRVSGEMKSTACSTARTWYRFRIDSTGSTNSKMTGFLALAIQ